jgi:hypothetical protein
LVPFFNIIFSSFEDLLHHFKHLHFSEALLSNIHRFSEIVNQFYELNSLLLFNYIKLIHQIDDYYLRFPNVILILLKKIVDVNSHDHEIISALVSQLQICSLISPFIPNVHQLSELLKQTLTESSLSNASLLTTQPFRTSELITTNFQVNKLHFSFLSLVQSKFDFL